MHIYLTIIKISYIIAKKKTGFIYCVNCVLLVPQSSTKELFKENMLRVVNNEICIFALNKLEFVNYKKV